MKNKAVVTMLLMIAVSPMRASDTLWNDFKVVLDSAKERHYEQLQEMKNSIASSFSAVQDSAQQSVSSVKNSVKDSVKKSILAVNSVDVAYYSLAPWFLHGLDGYARRFKTVDIADELTSNLEGLGKYERVKNSTFFEKHANFNKFHPIQSLRSGTPKIRNIPILGPLCASYLTGFSYHVLSDKIKNS